MRIADLAAGDPLLDAVHADILAVSFPPDELETRDWLTGGVADGTVLVAAALDESGAPAGAAVGQWSPGARTLLLAYLAVRSGGRAAGTGGRLLDRVTGPWQARLRPRLTLAEVEHPWAHTASDAYGDPAARLRFYARRGARVLDIPYFQPPLRPDSQRVYGMLLTVLTLTPDAAGPRPDTVDPAPLRAFLGEYYDEHADGGDPASEALGRALDRPDGIPLLPADDLAALPLSRPR
ncbi:hypothetical protein GCM10027168_57670 [Streptomyces capparidis]